MKLYKLLFLLVPLAFIVIAPIGAYGGDEVKSTIKQTGTVDGQKSPQQLEQPSPKQPEKPTPFQTETLKTLRGIRDQIKAAYEQYEANQKDYYSPSVVVQALLVVVGLAYTFFAARQWRATRTLADLERPWINVKPVPVDPLNWPFTQRTHATPPFLITVKWHAKNIGRSPAFLTRLSINFKPVPYPIPNAIPQYDPFPEFSEMLIGPSGDSHDSEWSWEVDQHSLNGILSHQLCIGFYGFAEYYDTLRKEKRISRFFSYWHIQNSSLPWRLTYVPVGPRKTVEYT